MSAKKDKINDELTIDWDWVKSEIIKEIITPIQKELINQLAKINTNLKK